jgi:hypothetical protein
MENVEAIALSIPTTAALAAKTATLNEYPIQEVSLNIIHSALLYVNHDSLNCNPVPSDPPPLISCTSEQGNKFAGCGITNSTKER